MTGLADPVYVEAFLQVHQARARQNHESMTCTLRGSQDEEHCGRRVRRSRERERAGTFRNPEPLAFSQRLLRLQLLLQSLLPLMLLLLLLRLLLLLLLLLLPLLPVLEARDFGECPSSRVGGDL